MKQAREKGLNRDTTEANAEERAELFKMVLIIDGSDTEARMGFDQAQKDIDAAHARDAATQKSKEDAVAAKRDKLRAAETALDAGDLKTADIAGRRCAVVRRPTIRVRCRSRRRSRTSGSRRRRARRC